MSHYALRIVKTHTNDFQAAGYMMTGNPPFDFSTKPVSVYPASAKFYKAYHQNQYIVYLKGDSMETLRYIVNTIIRAEAILYPNHIFHYTLCYRLEVGERLDETTPMFTMFNLRPLPHNFRDTWFPPNNPSVLSEVPPRHTLRGSGRYEAIWQNDPPYYFAQIPTRYTSPVVNGVGIHDGYIGLGVNFSRLGGKASKIVYQGAVRPENYSLSSSGRIEFNRFGNIYKGDFQAYNYAMQLIAPMFSAAYLDEDGVLTETGKVCSNGLPMHITEFKAQRRVAYSNDGHGALFKRRLLDAIALYRDEVVAMIKDINLWGHNLNYDVEGYRKTQHVYTSAERIARMIANHFPNQLQFDTSKISNKYNFAEVNPSDYLELGNRKEDAVRCFDMLCQYVEWLRRNWVDYTELDISELDLQDCETVYKRLYKDPVTYTETEDRTAYWPRDSFNLVHYTIYRTYSWRKISTYGYYLNVKTEYDRPGDPHYLSNEEFTNTVFSTHYTPVRNNNIRWSQDNVWRVRTRGTASDIEQSYLTFQKNALKVIDLLCHFEATCYPRPYNDASKKKGVLPGEIIRTREMDLNRRRRYPRRKVPLAPETRVQGDLSSAPTRRAALPNFAPLQIDPRGIVRRCEIDPCGDDQKEEQLQQQADQAARDEFSWKQKIYEQRRTKEAKKFPSKWRNEIDPTDAIELAQEEYRMLQEMQRNVHFVQDVAEAAFDIILIVGTDGIATPFIAEKRVLKGGAEKATEALTTAPKRREIDVDIDIPELDLEDWNPPSDNNAPEVEYNPPKPKEDDEWEPEEPDEDEREVCDEPINEPRPMRHDEYTNPYGVYDYVFQPARNGIDLAAILAREPRRGRTLIQKGLRYFADRDTPTGPGSWTERNPLERWRCVRAPFRLPRP